MVRPRVGIGLLMLAVISSFSVLPQMSATTSASNFAEVEAESSPNICNYSLIGIGGATTIHLSDVKLMIHSSSYELLLYVPLSSFNQSGNVYYHDVRFVSVANAGVLTVGDYFQFNKTIYWGAEVRLISNDETTSYCQFTLESYNGVFSMSVPSHGYMSSPDASFILIPTLIAIIALPIGAWAKEKNVKTDKSNRRSIWPFVALLESILVTIFIAGILYSMVVAIS